ncbi:family 20 glycosylhydrolase [Spirosoma migulaei]
MRNLVCFLILLKTLDCLATHPPLLPAPQQVVWTEKSVGVKGVVSILAQSPGSAAVADSIRDFLKTVGGASVRLTSQALPAKGALVITVSLENELPALRQNQEGYQLLVSPGRIDLKALTATGLFWGYRTLQQLTDVKRKSIAGCTIIDFPAFPIRGFMHDVGRSFIPIETLKRHIDLLSHYKINTFHWHLTEDLAWRLQSDVVPRLTDSLVTTRFPGQFYTKQQARDLVDYCKQRHVLLIPEIDMPGHSAAFRRATGYDMQSGEGKELVKQLLREVCDLFDVPYLHIGTDEVAFKDSLFVPEMANVVRDCGKEVIGWLPGARLDKKMIRQLWMSTVKPTAGQPVIDSRNLYLNHFSTLADLISVYQRTICDTTWGSSERLGAIACVWNDRKQQNETEIERLNGFYPIMLALAERTWRGGGLPETQAGTVIQNRANFAEFEDRLLAHKRQHFSSLEFPYVRQSNIHWRISQPVANQGKLDAVFPSETRNLDFQGIDAIGGTIYLRHLWGPDVVRAYLTNPQPNHTVYAYTYVFSARAQTVGAWITFHNYGRSEKDASPPQGQWDYKGSKIWVNDQELRPPIWTNAGLHPLDNEQPYTNEPYENRPPEPVTLKKGWNKVLIKLPIGEFRTDAYRLAKWMFTCVFVRQVNNQLEAIDGLVYSPDKKKR